MGPRIHPQEQEVLPGESCSTRRSCRLKLSRDRLSLIQQGAAERQHEALSVLINQQMEMKNSSSSTTDVAPSFQMLNFLILGCSRSVFVIVACLANSQQMSLYFVLFLNK